MDLLSFGLVLLEAVFGTLDRVPCPGEDVFVEPFAFSLGGALDFCSGWAARRGAGGPCHRVGQRHRVEVGYDVRHERRGRRFRVGTGKWSRVGDNWGTQLGGDRAFITHVPGVIKGGHRMDQWLTALERMKPTWCCLHSGPDVVQVLKLACRLGIRVALDFALEKVERDS